jgi:polyphosphate glucokinase
MAKKRRHKTTKKRILVIDIGGTHVKFEVSGHSERREFASGPRLSAKRAVAKIKQRIKDWHYDMVSIGYPGPVIHGHIVAEPQNLGSGWVGFNFAKAFRRPVRLVNDAVLQAVGSYEGGRMLFLGLGTGLGSAMIIDGVIEPMELAHLPYRKGQAFEDYVGTAGLERHGKKKWRRHVRDVIKQLSAALEPDYVVLGGGNAGKMNKLPRNVRLGGNDKAFEGGYKLWNGPAGRLASPLVPTGGRRRRHGSNTGRG